MPHLTLRKRNALFGVPYRVQAGQLVPDAEWQARNLTTVRLWGIDYPVHHRVKAPFLRLIDAWQQAGLLPRVKTIDRFWEWATVADGTRLRRHCHGNAFDANERWNPIGYAAHHRYGGTLPLLAIARAQGWACGADRGPVAKHFELAELG